MSYSAEKLENLSRIAEELNKETDALKDSVSDLDKRLGKMKIGATVWLDHVLKDGENEDANSYLLGYTKIRDKWRIAVRRDDEGSSELALSKAPRLIRVQALNHLDELLDALTERANEFLSTLRKHKEAAARAVAPDGAEAADEGASETNSEETADES